MMTLPVCRKSVRSVYCHEGISAFLQMPCTGLLYSAVLHAGFLENEEIKNMELIVVTGQRRHVGGWGNKGYYKVLESSYTGLACSSMLYPGLLKQRAEVRLAEIDGLVCLAVIRV